MRRYAGVSVEMVESKFWLAEKFSRPQAWLDLVMMANWKECPKTARSIRTYRRGCIYKSNTQLGERWKWSTTKVSGFLKELANDGKILINGTGRYREVEIVNYDYAIFLSSEKENMEKDLGVSSKTECENELLDKSPKESDEPDEDDAWFDSL